MGDASRLGAKRANFSMFGSVLGQYCDRVDSVLAQYWVSVGQMLG